MGSFIISIIVKLLIEFLIALFKKRVAGERYQALSRIPSIEDDFVGKMKYRFWLGPHRYDIARLAFRVAAKRHDTAVRPVGMNGAGHDVLAQWLCLDIEKEISL